MVRPKDRSLWVSQELAWKFQQIVRAGAWCPVFATAEGVWYVWDLSGEVLRYSTLWRVTLRCDPSLQFRHGPGLIPFLGQTRPSPWREPRRIPII
jgi:hypothetical protein